ncbi:EAL domain-containing protein [Dyella sp. A6]|uniref:EAL domain-containing protein n=1 Tax=Dyella aluminiiresistens TaxID=3069105 RepID=UPI002E76EFF3|nr:EAL domain-containing protein [Dyella sp. A6]
MSAHAAPKVLHVVGDNNYPPYLFLGPDGKPEGYIVDLWKLWSSKTGVPVDLQPMQWSDAQKAMADGHADVIDMIFHTPARNKLYTFSPPYSTQTVGIYVDHTIQGISNVHALSGFQIGVERGDACTDKLASFGIDSVVNYPNYEAILAAAKSGVIKIFCMDDEPANYYLYLSRDNLRFAKAFTLYQGRFHWAVRRGDSATYALVEHGMKLITPAEQRALRAKWFKHPLEFPYSTRRTMIVLSSALGIMVLLALWILVLRRAVRMRTAEILEKSTQLEHQAHELLLERAQLRTLVESSPDAMWLKSSDGTYVDCNARAMELVGLPREAIIGHGDGDLPLDTQLLMQVREIDRRVYATGSMQSGEFIFNAPDGTRRNIELVKVPIRARSGEITGVLAVARDVTERQRMANEQRIAAVAFESQDGIVISNARGIIQRVNSAFARLSGHTAAEAVGLSLKKLLRSGIHNRQFYAAMDSAVASSGNWNGEIWYRKKNGELLYVRIAISAVRDEGGVLQHTVCSVHDITTEMEATARAERLEKIDPLTDLPNRIMLEERMLLITQAKSDDELCSGALLLIGLDDFSQLNSVHGHKLGDQILQQAAQRIRRLAPDGGLLARITGDEFALLVTGKPQAAARATDFAQTLAQALCDALAEPYFHNTTGELLCTASIGATLLGCPHRSIDTLLSEAELAMFKAKRAGKNTVRMFAAEMQKEIEARNAMANDLRSGMAKGQFTLEYQAQVDVRGRVVGAEALLRWNHPRRGRVSPVEFIPVAEQTGMIEPLGAWVLEQACRTLDRWSAMPEARWLTLSVNVSPRQFRRIDFVDEVEMTMTGCSAATSKLKLEITESMAMEDIGATVVKLDALKRMGIRVSVDDFGTGNSSLSYLTRLPLDQLKIDKSFVQNLPTIQNDAHVAQTIIGMARGMGLEVVAEGVESREQFLFLKEQACDLYQGYLFGKPMPLHQFEQDLARTQTVVAAS